MHTVSAGDGVQIRNTSHPSFYSATIAWAQSLSSPRYTKSALQAVFKPANIARRKRSSFRTSSSTSIPLNASPVTRSARTHGYSFRHTDQMMLLRLPHLCPRCALACPQHGTVPARKNNSYQIKSRLHIARACVRGSNQIASRAPQ
jgi:hypothetical protein